MIYGLALKESRRRLGTGVIARWDSPRRSNRSWYAQSHPGGHRPAGRKRFKLFEQRPAHEVAAALSPAKECSPDRPRSVSVLVMDETRWKEERQAMASPVTASPPKSPLRPPRSPADPKSPSWAAVTQPTFEQQMQLLCVSMRSNSTASLDDGDFPALSRPISADSASYSASAEPPSPDFVRERSRSASAMMMFSEGRVNYRRGQGGGVAAMPTSTSSPSSAVTPRISASCGPTRPR